MEIEINSLFLLYASQQGFIFCNYINCEVLLSLALCLIKASLFLFL